MAMQLEFNVPYRLEENTETKEIQKLLDKVHSSLKIEFKTILIDDKKEEELKKQYLWNLAILNRIKIKQTKRNKSLYPQLIVFVDNKPVTFFPQSRPKEEISIQAFLNGLLDKEVRCLHDKYVIERDLGWRK
jgi:hypothetical protein